MFNEVIVVLGLLVASFTDLRERIIPNWLNYALLLVGVLYHAYLSFVQWSLTPLIYSFAGLLIAFVFAYLLWRIGAWAGGDVKLFTALGALVPTPLIFGLPLFPFIILVFSVLVSFPFLVVYVVFKSITEKRLHKSFKKMCLTGSKQGVLLGAVSIGSMFFLPFVGLPSWFGLPLAVVLFLVPRYVGLIGFAFLFMFGAANPLQSLELLLVGFVAAFFWQVVSYGRHEALRTQVLVKDLKEGMISAEFLVWLNKKVSLFSPSLKQKLVFFEPEETLVSPYNAAGLEKKQIAMLKRRGVRALWVKESMPMVPLFLCGAVLALLLSEFVLVFLQGF